MEGVKVMPPESISLRNLDTIAEIPVLHIGDEIMKVEHAMSLEVVKIMPRERISDSLFL